MRIHIGFQSSLLLALAAHLCVFSLFLFTFPALKQPAKPVLVFLGSFLRSQDVAFSSVKSGTSPIVDIHNVNLDIRSGSIPRVMDKPSLTEKVASEAKQQYKPLMREPVAPSRHPENSDDLGIDLEPFKPVKLRIEQ